MEKKYSNEQAATQLQELWELAKQEAKIVVGEKGLDPRVIPKALNPESLVNAVQEKEHTFSSGGKPTSEKKTRLIGVLKVVVNAFTNLCELVSSAASTAYPPASIIFACIKHLVEAGNGVKDSFESMITIFGDFQSFLQRLTVYDQREINVKLKAVIIKMLVGLIQACGVAAAMMKRGKVLAFFKAIIVGNDDRAKGMLATLERLREEEAGMVRALTYDTTRQGIEVTTEYGERTNENLDLLRNEIRDLKNRDKEDQEHKVFDRLRALLNPTVASDAISNTIKSGWVVGTGNWVHEMSAYVEWYERKIPVVWLWGHPGSGKSYVTYNIIDTLTKEYRQNVQSADRVSVAAFFCRSGKEELCSMAKALQTISYQICENDKVYARYVSDLHKYPEDVRGIWEVLFLEFFTRMDMPNVAYIIIDGLDVVEEEERTVFLDLLLELLESSDSNQKSRLNVMVSGRPELGIDNDFSVPMIMMTKERSAKDIQEYIQHFFKRDRILKRVSAKLKGEIVQSLTEGADAGFLWVHEVLKVVASEKREPEMRKALLSAPRHYFEMIEQLLSQFKETDIDDLNEMLSWVFNAKRSLKLGELNDILLLKTGDGVVYLEGELRTRYASLFYLLRQDGKTTEDLQQDHRHAWEMDILDIDTYDGSTDEDVAKPEPQALDIESNPITTDVGLPRSIRDFFERGGRKDAAIRIDVQQSAIDITKSLLHMFCDDENWSDWNLKSLSTYAACYWIEHFNMIDLAKTSIEDKRLIASYLLKLFRNETVILRWAGKCGLIKENFVLQRNGVDVIQKWLSDPDILGDLDESTKVWVQSLHPQADVELMDQLMQAIAVEAFQKRVSRWCPEIVIGILHAHTSYLKSRQDGTEPPATAAVLANVDVNELRRSVQWAKLEEDAYWHSRLGRAYQLNGHSEEAVKEHHTAIGLDPNTWRSYIHLSSIHAENNRFESAINSVLTALKILEANSEVPEVVLLHQKWCLRKLGQWYWELNKEEEALKTLEKYRTLEGGEWDNSTIKDIINLLLDIGDDEPQKAAKVLSLLQECKDAINPKTEETRLTDLCLQAVWDLDWDDFGYDMLYLAENGPPDTTIFIKGMYKDAIQAAKKASNIGVLSLLEFEYGYFLYTECRDDVAAVKRYEAVLSISANPKPGTEFYAARNLAAEELAAIHFNSALVHGKGTAEADRVLRQLIHLSDFNQKHLMDQQAAEHEIDFSEVFDSTQSSILFLGLYYSQILGNEKEARECFKNHLKLGIDLLSDKDSENDWQGYLQLVDVFKRSGNDDDAIAAYSLLQLDCDEAFLKQKLERMAKESKAQDYDSLTSAMGEAKISQDNEFDNSGSSSDSGSDDGRSRDEPSAGEAGNDSSDSGSLSDDEDNQDKPFAYTCDGCNEDFESYASHDACRFCLDVDFCPDCSVLHTNGEIAQRICHPKHKFLTLPAFDKNVPKGSVKVGDSIMTVADWLQKIKQEWGMK